MLIDFRELFPKYNIRPKGVLHVGANVGEEAPVYKELGILRQIWVEANYDIFQKLEQNLSDNPQAYPVHACISDVPGEKVIFNVSNNGSQSSSILDLGTHATVHPEVRYINSLTMRAQTLMGLYGSSIGPVIDGCDFLNIDLQGAELKALRGMGMLLSNFKWAYLEVNKEELYKGCALVEEIDGYMKKFSFKRVETKWCGNTGWGDALYIK